MSCHPLRFLVAGVVLSVASASAAAATPVPPVQRLDISLPLAMQLLDVTLETCHAKGRTVVAAVVDRSGNLVALQRDDNVGPHNTLAAQRKAYTALSTKTATSVLSERARSQPDSANLTTIDALLLLGGGVPLLAQGQVIGALGVAAAGGAAMDEYCATQAIHQLLPQIN